MNYYSILSYAQSHGKTKEEVIEKVLLEDHGDGEIISRWDLDIPQPTAQQLEVFIDEAEEMAQGKTAQQLIIDIDKEAQKRCESLGSVMSLLILVSKCLKIVNKSVEGHDKGNFTPLSAADIAYLGNNDNLLSTIEHINACVQTLKTNVSNMSHKERMAFDVTDDAHWT